MRSIKLPSAFSNPKRRESGVETRASWFPYYAGYSSNFVLDALNAFAPNAHSTILDPWAGSGTTSEVAVSLGYRVSAFDINPAAVAVARARTINKRSAEALLIASQRVVESAIRILGRDHRVVPPDPLCRWLTPQTAHYFRAIQVGIDQSAGKFAISLPRLHATDRSRLRAALYVAMFRALRSYLTCFQGSNPTWIRSSNNGAHLAISPDEIFGAFVSAAEYLAITVLCEPVSQSFAKRGAGRFLQASSSSLPIKDAAIDLVISSPPYCTRIDYVRATLPELTAMGYSDLYLRNLSERMIGTTTMTQAQMQTPADWGKTCSRFLNAVREHASKASSTYYLRYFQQYFSQIHASLKEIDRVLARNSTCVLVVQDSFYKEILNDLPTIFCEMGETLRWSLKKKFAFSVDRTLAATNPRVRRYRKNYGATETALIFTRN